MSVRIVDALVLSVSAPKSVDNHDDAYDIARPGPVTVPIEEVDEEEDTHTHIYNHHKDAECGTYDGVDARHTVRLLPDRSLRLEVGRLRIEGGVVVLGVVVHNR